MTLPITLFLCGVMNTSSADINAFEPPPENPVCAFSTLWDNMENDSSSYGFSLYNLRMDYFIWLKFLVDLWYVVEDVQQNSMSE